MKAKDLNGGKPYAFVTFRTKELASRAIEELNNSEFKGNLSTLLVDALSPFNNPSHGILIQGCAQCAATIGYTNMHSACL